MRERRAGIVLITLGIALVLLVGCNEDRSKRTERMLAAGKANPNAAAKPPEKSVVVHEDCTYSPPDPIELSVARAERVHWMLEGGSGGLRVELKSTADDLRSAWKNDLKLRCAGAECWGTVTPAAKAGNRHEYRFLIGEKACPDPFLIIKP